MAVPSLGGVTAQLLPRLTQETELLKILTDEKMRGEQHKTNYQLLKMEHTRLQDEHLSLQNEIKNLLDDNKASQDKIQVVLEQCQRDLSTKETEVEQLKSQILTPQRLEIIHLRVQEEVEQSFKEKFLIQNQEIEKIRNDYNRLRYDHSFLKSEYEHAKAEQQRVIEELNLKHKAEISSLTRECEILTSRLNSDPSQDTQKVRNLQRENGQLQLKVKGLLTELEEIRAQREHAGLQADNVTRLQAKQLSEHAGNIKALEAEKESLKFQLQNMQKEMNQSVEQHLQLSNKIYELEKTNSELRNKLDESSYKNKMELTNLRMNMVKEKGEIERERDALLNDLEDTHSQVEVMKKMVEQQTHQIIEKDRESQRRIQIAREEEWLKITKVETEKLDLEGKIQELERHRIDEDSQRQIDLKKADDKVRQVAHTKEMVEKECNSLRVKLKKHQTVLEELEKEKNSNSELRQQILQLETDLHNLSLVHQDLQSHNSKLKNSIDLLSSELKVVKTNYTKMQDSDDKVLAQHKNNAEEAKQQYIKRIEELEHQISQLHINYNSESQAVKKKKQRYIKIIFKLKDKVQNLDTQISELKVEQERYRNFVSLDVHAQVKKQLRDLQRRHNEFKQVLFSCAHFFPNGDVTFTGLNLGPESQFFHPHTDQEQQHQQHLQFLKDRLDHLATNQRKQMEDLTSIPLTTQKTYNESSHSY